MNIEVKIVENQDPVPLSYSELKDEPVERRLAHWFINGEVGLSSNTLASWCMSIRPKRPSRPHDASDRLRCIKLLELIPEWQKYLDSMPYGDWDEQKQIIKQEMIDRGSWTAR